MQAIGIEKGKPFNPDDKTKALLSEAARLGGAIARANTYASSSPGVFYYPDRKWQGVPDGMTYTFERQGAPQIDARNNVYYMAAGNSPSMMEKNIGQGSQYLWTYRDADGNFLDGAKTYKLHVLPNIPASNFWSVVVYDALSRSELQNGQPFPSVSSYTKPIVNADGSIDIVFGPDEPKEKGNWIKTVARQGLVSDLPVLWTRGGVLRQDLEARGHRRCEVKEPHLASLRLLMVEMALLRHAETGKSAVNAIRPRE